jgi:protein-L-isoaspartate(D-aspartate) O-methyltransferase
MHRLMITCISMALLWSSCVKSSDKTKTGTEGGKDNFAYLRQQMVDLQLYNRGIRDERVLKVMRTVPRHEFVPQSEIKSAYDDSPLPIGYDQTISQPYIVAYMTEKLELKGDEKVLEIGTGSGYQAAILAELAREVYTIEIVEPLCHSATERLARLGYQNIKTLCGDGYQGWPQYAPFDAIIVTAAPRKVPSALIEQLNKGGRLIAPVGNFFQEIILMTKKEDGSIKRQTLIPVRFVPMTGEAQREK